MTRRVLVLALLVAAVAGSAAVPARPAEHDAPAGVLYFTVSRDGANAVYRANPDGTGLQRLAGIHPDSGEGSFSVAPNGSALGFTMNERLYFAGPDGSGVHPGPGRFGSPSAWSPDGKLVAYTSISGDNETAVVSTSGARTAVIPISGEGDPAWSPRGDLIAFPADSYTGAHNGPGIYTARPDGTQVRPLLTGGVFKKEDPFLVRWSPDATELAVATTYGTDAKEHIYVLPSSGGPLRRLTKAIEKNVSIAWSPDGSQLAFASRRGPGPTEIYVIHADGSGEHAVTHATGGESSVDPQWSPDGARLGYVRGRFAHDEGGTGDVYLVQADGTRTVPLLPSARLGDAAQLAWTQLPALPATKLPPDASVRISPRFTLRTNGVDELAATATAVVVEEAAPPGYPGFTCGPVVLWHPQSGSAIRGGMRCNTPSDILDSLGLAGGTPVWRWSQWNHSGGADYPTSECTVAWQPLRASSPAEPPWRESDTGCSLKPPWLRRHNLVSIPQPRAAASQLVASGSTVLYNAVRVSCVGDWARTIDQIANPLCRRGRAPRLRSATLWRLAGTRFVPLRTTARLLVLDAVEGGLAAGRESEHAAVVIRLSDGRIVRRRHFGPVISGIRLQDGRLAVQTGTTLTLMGRTTRRYTLSAGDGPPRLGSLGGNLATYTSGIDLHLLRLSDGRDVTLRLANAAGPVSAVLVPGGLCYGYNVRHAPMPGRISFVPAARLAAAFATPHAHR